MQLTADQAQLYEMDPNQYIADEEDEAFNYNPRVAATSVLQSIAENYRSYLLVELNNFILILSVLKVKLTC